MEYNKRMFTDSQHRRKLNEKGREHEIAHSQ